MTYAQAVVSASQRALLSGITHYVLQNSIETWVAGQGAKDNFWANLTPVATYNARGERVPA